MYQEQKENRKIVVQTTELGRKYRIRKQERSVINLRLELNSRGSILTVYCIIIVTGGISGLIKKATVLQVVYKT